MREAHDETKKLDVPRWVRRCSWQREALRKNVGSAVSRAREPQRFGSAKPSKGAESFRKNADSALVRRILSQGIAIRKSWMAIPKHEITLPKQRIAIPKQGITIQTREIVIRTRGITIPQPRIGVRKRGITVPKRGIAIGKQGIVIRGEENRPSWPGVVLCKCVAVVRMNGHSPVGTKYL